MQTPTHKIKTNYLSLDLELNQDLVTGPKIIQVGACVFNMYSGEVLEKLSVFVDPKQPLLPFITQLTKIKQSDVDGANSLLYAYQALRSMHIRHECFVNPVQWGGGDSKALLDQLKKENPEFTGWCLGRRELDAKTLYCALRIADGQHPAGGLSRALNYCKLKFQGQAHSALDDSINTAVIFRYLVRKFKHDTT